MPNQYSTIAFIITIISLLVLLASLLIKSLLLYQKKQFLFQKSIEEVKLNAEINSMRLQIEVQEEAFLQISREMHDSLAHDLSASNLCLRTLDYLDPISSKEKINTSVQLITKVTQNIRDISKSLNSELIKRNGLFHALDEEISIIKRTGFSSFYYTMTGEPFSIPGDKGLFIFRIIQESISNILKHSRATEIHLTLNFTKSNLKIVVEDNGVGFDSHLITQKPINSCGLSNIIERTKILEGNCEIISSPGNGTKVILNIPFLNSNTINHEHYHDHNNESSLSR